MTKSHHWQLLDDCGDARGWHQQICDVFRSVTYKHLVLDSAMTIKRSIECTGEVKEQVWVKVVV